MSYQQQLERNYHEIHQRLYGKQKVQFLKIVKKELDPLPPPPEPIQVELKSKFSTQFTLRPQYTLSSFSTWFCQQEQVGIRDLRSQRRVRHLSYLRYVFYHLGYKYLFHSSADIGRFLRKDHSSVLHGIRKLEELRKSGSALDEKIKQYERIIMGMDGDKPSVCPCCGK